LTNQRHDFNDVLRSAIDDTIVEALGRDALASLYERLKTDYSVTREELPYRTETIYKILETSYDIVGAKTVGNRIAQKLYAKLGLPFYSHEGYTLPDYIELAKTGISP
jgi:hypothetical protein